MYPKAYLYKKIEDARILIDRNYSKCINLDEIAEKVCLSKYHFLRLFKKAYGMPPHKYLIRKRIDVAVSLLQTNLPVSSVCREVGYESVHSFSHLFRRQIGMSPTQFRKMMIGRKNSNSR